MNGVGENSRGKEFACEGESLFRTLAENAAVCFGIIQGNRFLYINPFFSTMTGYSREEMLAMEVGEVIHPEHRREVLEALSRVQEEGTAPVQCEFRLRTRRGKELWIDFSAGRIILHNRPALAAVACDVTRRKLVEVSLREGENRYRSLFQSIQETFALDELIRDSAGRPADWRILEVNPAYEKVFELPADQVVGKLAREVYGSTVAEQYLSAFDQVVTTGSSVRLEHYEAERDRTFIVSVFPLGGDRFGTLGLEITERKRAEADRERLFMDVERRMAEMEATINSIADAVIIYGAEGQIIRMNQMAEREFVFAPDEMALPMSERRPQMHLELPDGTAVGLKERPFWRALQGETIRGFIALCRRQGRKPLWVSISAAPIRLPDGRTVGAVVSLTDITGMRELQEQREIFLQTLSHDLRTPLTIVSGHAQLLQSVLSKLQVDRALTESLEAILQGSRSMEEMIAALVDTVFLESGQLVLKKAAINLSEFLETLLRRAEILETRRIEAVIEPGLPPVPADPVRLERILLNLISNALKYSPPGSPVRLEAGRAVGGIEISVIDSGRGIDAEDLPHIFQRFYRTRRGRKGRGIGLGLYISRLLVEAHGGWIRADSAPGRGSTFTFMLPAAEDEG